MSKKKNNENDISVDFVEETKKPLFNPKGLLKGTFITKEVIFNQFPFILFLSFIAIINIWNGYNTKTIYRNTRKIENELKLLRSEQIAVSSELMKSSSQSSVLKIVNEFNIGLKELTVPPTKIFINENK
jgi:hypothetical protein